jgi:hemerythrin-like domain-containing protein
MDHLTVDHRRLTTLFDQARRLVDEGALAQATDAFQTFAQRARHHMRIEERWLFPCFEERTASCTGPTAMLRGEHRRLERLLDEAAAALERGSAADFRDVCRRLTLIVEDHTFHEEEKLYPVLEEILSPKERELYLRDLHDEPLLPPEAPEAARRFAGG